MKITLILTMTTALYMKLQIEILYLKMSSANFKNGMKFALSANFIVQIYATRLRFGGLLLFDRIF